MTMTSEELNMLRASTRGWIAHNAPAERFRALRDAGESSDGATLAGLAELGWSGALIDTTLSGLSLGATGAIVLAEECGRELVAVPIAQGMVGAAAALSALPQNDAVDDLLRQQAGGALTPVLALDGAQPERLLSGRIAGDAIMLTGELRFVSGLSAASTVLVPVRCDGEIRIIMVSPEGVAGVRRILVDRRDYSAVAFSGEALSEATLLPGVLKEEAFAHTLDLVRLTHTAEMLGLSQKAFDMAIDYLRTREQFGKPIGAFQALQHRAAQMLCNIEVLRAAVEAGAQAADTNSGDLPRLVALAKSYAGETIRLVMAEALQFHGGIGMTDAHDVGLYFKRGRVTEFLMGDTAAHRTRYAALVGL